MAALSAALLAIPLWGQRGGRGGMGGGRGGYVEGPLTAARLGEAVRAVGMGMALTLDIILTIPDAIRTTRDVIPGGVIAAITVMAGMDILGLPGDGMEALAGRADTTRAAGTPIPSLSIRSMSTPTLTMATATYNQQQEIDRLNDEVARLRAEREPGSAANPAPQPPPKTQIRAATVLVFRDRHTEEIENYAVVGRTLWVFTEQRARKIPIATLDVPATTKANDARGIDFRLPAQ